MRRVLNSSEPTGLKPSKVGDSYQPNPASETDDIIFSLWVYLERRSKYISELTTQEEILNGLNLTRAVECALSPTSATVTSPQIRAPFEASPQGLRSEVHSAVF